MRDEVFRNRVHQAVEAQGAHLRDDPFLARRLLALSQEKEKPIVKRKLSLGMILLIVLLVTAVTAIAIGLTAEEIWKNSFERMNTEAVININGDPEKAEMTVEEAIRLAREAIVAKYGTPAEELDAMGVYPSYYGRDWADSFESQPGDYPSEWNIYFSARTDVELDSGTLDYGPLGEYRVYINAETGEITYCNWYTNNFWERAQQVWDCGSYDEVYWHYGKAGEFYQLPIERQLYFEELLASQGYELIPHSGKYMALLSQSILDRRYCDPSLALPEDDPQAAAAWAAIEAQYGYDPALLRKHCYMATRSAHQTGTDDVFLVYNTRIDDLRLEAGYLNQYCMLMGRDVRRCGSFLVSFDPGTTHVAFIARHWFSEEQRVTRNFRGDLYEQTDWHNDDLIAFDAAFERFTLAMARMTAAGCTYREMETVYRDYIGSMGGSEESFPRAPEGTDTAQWFVDVSEWDALIEQPETDFEELVARYGTNILFWPLEVQVRHTDNPMLTLPEEGEMTQKEAVDRALALVVSTHGQEALEALGEYSIGCQLFRYENGGEVTRWEVYITDDPEECLNGWRVNIFRRDGKDWVPDEIQHITDGGNG